MVNQFFRIMKKEKQEKREMEICIYCGVETNVPKNLHIDFRENYIKGAGQLCRKCYNKIYKDVD